MGNSNKYRITQGTIDDELYANRVKEYFAKLDVVTRNHFNRFTSGLMNDKYISWSLLTKAIIKYNKLYEPFSDRNWAEFVREANSVAVETQHLNAYSPPNYVPSKVPCKYTKDYDI